MIARLKIWLIDVLGIDPRGTAERRRRFMREVVEMRYERERHEGTDWY